MTWLKLMRLETLCVVEFCFATWSASLEVSVAMIFTSGSSSARVMAMFPLPVPMSMIVIESEEAEEAKERMRSGNRRVVITISVSACIVRGVSILNSFSKRNFTSSISVSVAGRGISTRLST